MRACAVLDCDRSAIVAKVGGPDSPANKMREINRRKTPLKATTRLHWRTHLHPACVQPVQVEPSLDLPLCLERVQNSARSPPRSQKHHPATWPPFETETAHGT